jgi:hypothetical protein
MAGRERERREVVARIQAVRDDGREPGGLGPRDHGIDVGRKRAVRQMRVHVRQPHGS